MSLSLHLPISSVLLHEGRRIRFKGEPGNLALRFSDVGPDPPYQIQRARERALLTKD
jgi:hypothetical protein